MPTQAIEKVSAKHAHFPDHLDDGRIDWEHHRNKRCMDLFQQGLYARKIAEIANLSVAQVHYRLAQQGVTLRSVREGETKMQKDAIRVICTKWKYV